MIRSRKNYTLIKTRLRGIPAIFVDSIPSIKEIRKINISNYSNALADTEEALYWNDV